MKRQAILDRADPPDVVFVLDETVTTRTIGSPAIMHDALVHAAELARRSRIVDQVVPAGAAPTRASAGRHRARSTPDTLRMERIEHQITETITSTKRR